MSPRTSWYKTSATRSIQAPVDTHPIATMLLQISFTLSFSFSLRNNSTCERHLLVSEEENIKPRDISNRKVEPQTMTSEPVVVGAPAWPLWSRLARFFQTRSARRSGPVSRTDDIHMTETPLAKAKDHESLAILLQSSRLRQQPEKVTAFDIDAADKLSDPSLVHHSPVVSLDTLPEDPFGPYQSRVFEEDSGSNLVSSLQRIRLGSLSPYLIDLDQRANVPRSSSKTDHVNMGKDEWFAAGEEAGQPMKAYDVADEEWDEVTVRETSDEEQ
jgi:hypothetical protein